MDFLKYTGNKNWQELCKEVLLIKEAVKTKEEGTYKIGSKEIRLTVTLGREGKIELKIQNPDPDFWEDNLCIRRQSHLTRLDYWLEKIFSREAITIGAALGVSVGNYLGQDADYEYSHFIVPKQGGKYHLLETGNDIDRYIAINSDVSSYAFGDTENDALDNLINFPARIIGDNIN